MHPALTVLRNDPQFWQLSPTDQVNFAYKYLDREIGRTHPAWQTEDPEKKDLYLRKLALEAPTFNDEVYGQKVKELGTRLYAGANGSALDKGLSEGWMATINASGIMGAIESVFQGANAPTVQEDRRRMLEYFKAVDTVSKRSDLAGEIGNLVGNVADIIGVNLIMSPAVGAATKAIQVAARGGAAAIKVAAAAGKTAPVLKSALAFYGPIAAESLIEAIPYYLVGEQKAIQQGKPTIASQGALEVAKNFGVNAAADFVIGTAVTKLLGYALRTGQKVFLNKANKELFADAFKTEAEFDALLDQIAVGNLAPEANVRMTEFDKAKQFNRFMFNEFMKTGATDPDLFPRERMGYWGVREGTVWNEVQEALADGKTKTAYKLFQFTEEGRPIAQKFENFNDLENHIAYKQYLRYSAMTPEQKTFFDTTGAAYILRRGKMLNEAMSVLDQDALFEADPILKAAEKGFSKAKRRPIITRAEADKVYDLLGPGGHVVKANIPLQGRVVENINAHELNVLRGKGVARVANSDTPNAIFIGVNEALGISYDSATEIAQKIVARDGSLSLDEARASVMLNWGFDHFRHPDGTTEFFTTRAMRLIGEPEDVLLRLAKPTKAGSVTSRVIFTEMGKGKTTPASSVSKSAITIDAAISLFRKAPTVDDYNNFAKLYFAGREDTVINYAIKRVRSDMPGFHIDPKSGKWTLYVPSISPVTFDAEKRAATQLLTDLETAVKEAPGMQHAKSLTYWAERIGKAPNNFRLPGVSDPTEWAIAATQKLGGTYTKVADTITVSLPSGVKHFTSPDDALNFVARRTLDPAAMKNDLLRQGVKLTKSPEGTYVARSLRDGKFMAGGSLDAVLDTLEYVPSSLDISYGPRAIQIDPDGIHFEFAGKPIIAKQSEMFQLLDTFKDQAFLNKSMNVLTNQKGIIDFTPSSKYRVYLAKYKFEREFDTLAEARRYFARVEEMDDALDSEMWYLDSLAEMANKKMLDFWKTPQGYKIVAPDTIHTVKTIGEVAAVFRDYPDIEKSVPSILDPLDPSIEATVSQLADTFQGRKLMAGLNKYNIPPEFPAHEDFRNPNLFIRASGFVDSTDAFVEQLSKQTGNKTIHELYLNVEAGHVRANRDHNVVNRILNTAAKDSNGRFISSESRRKIFYHMAGQTEADTAKLASDFVERYKKPLTKLTPDEEIVADHVRRIMEKLSQKFHIDSNKLLFHYLPRLRDFATSDEGRKLMQGNIISEELVDRAFKGDVPKEIRAWFENERTDEIARFWLKDDVIEVAMLYSAQGHKKLYMNEAWKSLSRYLKSPDGLALGPGVGVRLEAYRANLMGSYHSNVERQIEDFGSTLFKKLAESKLGQSKFGQRVGMSDVGNMTESGKDLLRSMLGLTYFSSMGWKPWLAIRNTMQPLITLAPRFGLDWTMRAWKSVLELGDDYVEKLRRLGVISEKAPIVNQVFSSNTKLGRFAEKSMQWFKSGDDLTRAIADRTAELRFDNAYDAFKLGEIVSEAQFAELAGTEILNPVTRQSVWDSLTASKTQPELLAKARHEFADRVQLETQFSYSAAQQAPWQQGALGKFAGQFGAYSNGYRANLYRMFQYAPVKKRAEMVASYLAITGALWGTFEALKIKTNDFVPVAPSVFSGGPGLDIAINLMKSTDTGYEGKIARETVWNDLLRLAPGSAQFRYGKKAYEYAEQGDVYRTLLSLSSVPSIDE
jgi:hypothetical protein